MIQTIAENVLYELWFSIAESIFEKVCKAADLTPEQIVALRELTLKPNDYQIIIE
jgi:hypothetical protein